MIKRESVIFLGGFLLMAAFFFAVVLVGAVRIPLNEIIASLSGGEVSSSYYRTIIIEARLPMAIAALCCGSLLSVAGLMMQTVFHNPLAGPSVLGISSGASFGVALFTLSAGGLAGVAAFSRLPVFSITGALVGALVIMVILFAFSSVLKSAVTLLIVGIMVGYLCDSGISLLNYFSSSEEIKNFMVWGLGSFSGLRFNSSMWLLCISVVALLPSFLFVKPLNAMLPGERYLESVGYSPRKVRGGILFFTGVMTAVPTAFCGPIGFIGLIVPHLCRLLFRSSNHVVLMPGCVVFGAVVSLACALAGVIPSATFGVLPINVITPVIGVPVILYLLVNRSRLPYFS